MSCLKLFLLGPPRLERDDVPLEVDTRKAIALMAYLAVTGESHSRDALATLLWPDYDQSHARAALRRTLSALNKALAGEWLETDRETIGLKPGDNLWLDVEQFQRRLAACRTHGHSAGEVCPACLSPLTEAAGLYRDDFLAGFTLRDSPNFDEWQFFQSESLRRELAGALERLAYLHSAQEEFEPAITAARRWLALDPLHEPAHRYLMQLYTWSGQRAAAMRQYRECVRILDQELGVSPLEETTQLYQIIQENRDLPPPVALSLPSSTPKANKERAAPLRTVSLSPQLSSYPLVGRSVEWATLLDVYSAIGVDGHFIILEGEAGVGKTRLAEEFLTYVWARGGATIAARCYEGEMNLAYGPFIEGLRAAVAEPGRSGGLTDLPAYWLSEATRLLPELASMFPYLPPAPPLDNPGAQSRFFEGLSQVILSLSRSPQPGVLFFDDLHWADEASLDLLTYLVRRLRGRPLCILVTWRSEQLSVSHHLQHLLVEAQRAGLATRLRLPRLSRSAVMELVRSITAAGVEPSETLGERLYGETEGLPFFLVEYLATMVQGTEADGSNWSMPGSVRDLLHSRLATVSETGWQLLTTAAIIGRPFGFDLLREVSGRGEEETVTALEGLMAQGLITEMSENIEERGPSYDFSHEKLRSLVYEETSLARRRLLHRRVAEAIVTRSRGQREIGWLASQIAQHYRLAGQDMAAAAYFKLAGEYARTLYANAEGLAHFRSALALGHPQAAVLHEAIGDLQTLSGEYGKALTSYETAAALGGSEVLGRLEHKLGEVHHRRGEWELAESHFQAALDALGQEGSSGERARLYADWSRTAHQRNQTDRALELARRALELAEAAADVRALAQTHNILGILANSEGNLEKARYHLQQSLNLAERLDDPAARVAALNNLALAYGASGEVKRALELAEAALALCASQGDRHREAALHNNLADLLYTVGQSETAMTHLKQAVTIFAEIGNEASAPQPEIWKLVEW